MISLGWLWGTAIVGMAFGFLLLMLHLEPKDAEARGIAEGLFIASVAILLLALMATSINQMQVTQGLAK